MLDLPCKQGNKRAPALVAKEPSRMFSALPRFGLLLALLVAASPWVASPALAQFDDEFDDEFDEEFEEEPESPPASAASAEAEDDDFDDDPFDEDDDLESALAEEAEDDGAEQEEEEAEDDEPEDEDLRARLLRTQNTYFGPAGGLHAVDAGGGAVGSFRIQLATDFFSTSGFIRPGDDAQHVGGSLSLGWTVHENIELWASLQSYANSNDQGDPSLFQVLGDTQLGIKAFHRVSPILTVGGDVTLALLNTVGDIGLVLKSTSFGLRGNVTLDLRGLSNSVPFITRFNLQYFFDNSSKLVEDVEAERYANLEDPAADISNESRHLLTPIERFALNINRTDFLNINLGFEAPLRVLEDFYLSPLLEWTWNIPVNRQGYNCLFIPDDDPTTTDRPAPGEDGCLDRQGVGSFPMDLTLGLRVLPPVQGLSILLAADIGLTGKKRSKFVRELAPNAPYNLYLGLAYAFDAREPEPAEPEIREVERRVEVPIPPPLQGRVKGEVVEQGANTAVAGAIVAFPGRDLTALVAGNDGRFTTYRLDPGEVQLAVSHPDYNDGTCTATIPDERPEEGELEVEVRCELVALPRVGSVNGRVVSADGTAINGAQVNLSGPAQRTVSSGPDGSFVAADLPPGSYEVRVDAENYLIKMDRVEVAPREQVTPTITLVERPRNALVRVRRRDIQIRRKINFATNSAEILPSSEPLMTEIADVLIRNPQLTLIEIQGHTDNRGSRQRNMELSQQRAEAVRDWLVRHGVAATRLEARGYGPNNPLVPNITPANRARNRRVQFVIKEQRREE